MLGKITQASRACKREDYSIHNSDFACSIQIQMIATQNGYKEVLVLLK